MSESKTALKNLKVFVKDALKQAEHLKKSYSKCSKFKVNGSIDNLDDDQLESLEALVSRFGRLSDILIQKIFHSLDEIELVRSGTIIDLLNGAEKRKIIDSAHDFRDIRQTRSQIEHEYVTTGLTDLYLKTIEYTPRLLAACEKLEPYIGQLETKI